MGLVLGLQYKNDQSNSVNDSQKHRDDSLLYMLQR